MACAAAAAAPPSSLESVSFVRPALLLHLKVLVSGILVAVDLHVGHVTFLGSHRDSDRLEESGQ